MGYGPWVGGNWKDILQTAHVEFYILPLDDWRADFWPVCKKLRKYIETQPFNKVFDLIQFVLRHRQCPRGFADQLKRTFEVCQLAYMIDTGPPPTILPAVTQAEGNSVVESLRALREAWSAQQRGAPARGISVHQPRRLGGERSGEHQRRRVGGPTTGSQSVQDAGAGPVVTRTPTDAASGAKERAQSALRVHEPRAGHSTRAPGRGQGTGRPR